MDGSVQQTLLRPPITVSKLKEKRKKYWKDFSHLGIPQWSLTVEAQHPQLIPEQMTHQKNPPNQTFHNTTVHPGSGFTNLSPHLISQLALLELSPFFLAFPIFPSRCFFNCKGRITELGNKA